MRKILENPLITTILLILANLLSFIPKLQDPYFFMFGVFGNFFLTFCFAFLIMTTALNLNRIYKFKIFKYMGYSGIVIYFILYFKWVFEVHYTFAIGFFIMSYGVYVSFKFHLKKSLSKKDFF